MLNYQTLKTIESKQWRPQAIHYRIRFLFRLIFTAFALWFLVCGLILCSPAHADSMPPYEPQHEKILSYVGLQIDDDSITCLLFVDSNGKVERFTWYDEIKNYKTYINTKAVWDTETDMMALYDSQWHCIYSDWD